MTYHTLHNSATVRASGHSYLPQQPWACQGLPSSLTPRPHQRSLKHTCSVPHGAHSKSHTNTSFVSRARKAASERRRTPRRRTQELLWAKLGLGWLCWKSPHDWAECRVLLCSHKWYKETESSLVRKVFGHRTKSKGYKSVRREETSQRDTNQLIWSADVGWTVATSRVVCSKGWRQQSFISLHICKWNYFQPKFWFETSYLYEMWLEKAVNTIQLLLPQQWVC